MISKDTGKIEPDGGIPETHHEGEKLLLG